MTARVIPSLAILKVNFDRGQDVIENFVPFVAEALRTSATPEMSVQDLQAGIANAFGLTIPQGALQTILRRAARQGYVVRQQGLLRRNDEKLRDLAFGQTRARVLREVEALVDSAVAFAQDRYGLSWSREDAEQALLGFLEEGALSVLRAAVKGEFTPPTPRVQVASDFVVASFIADCHDREPLTFGYLETIVKGSMLAGAVLFPNLGEIGRLFQKVQVYFDTSFLLQALGYEGPARALPRRELLDLLYEENATLSVFEDTVDEIRGILNAAVQATRSTERPRDSLGPTIQYLMASGKTASDIELMIARVEGQLRNLRIHTVGRPPHLEAITLDERALEDTLKERMHYGREEAVVHDVDCVAAIHRLRNGRAPTALETCGAVFVTTNHHVADASRQFFQEHVPDYRQGSVPPCILDHVLTTLVWLKKPQAAPDLPAKMILADAYAALNPPDDLWRQYLDEIARLEESGEITPEDFYLLRFSTEARNALLEVTVGDSDAFGEGTVAQVLERARSQLTAEAQEQIRAAMEGRREAEEAAGAAEGRAFAVYERQQARVRSVSLWIGRSVSNIVFALGVLVLLTGSFVGLLVPDLPGGLISVVIGACVATFLIAGFANVVFGTSLASIRRRVEVSVSNKVESALRNLVGLDQEELFATQTASSLSRRAEKPADSGKPTPPR